MKTSADYQTVFGQRNILIIKNVTISLAKECKRLSGTEIPEGKKIRR